MEKNTKITLFVLVLIIVGIYIYTLPRFSEETSKVNRIFKKQTTPALVLLQEKVTGVYPDKLKITFVKDSVEKTVIINPNTKIEKIISQKNAKGEVEKQAIVEVNISDIKKGSLVNINYQTEVSNQLNGVNSISFVVNGSVDKLQISKPDTNVYMKGEIISVDTSSTTQKSIKYKTYSLNSTGATANMLVPDGIAIYKVSDQSRLSILHARVSITLADIKSKQVALFVLDTKALQKGKIIPQEIIILDK